MKKKFILLTYLFLFSIFLASTESYDLYFYGVVTNINDDSMIKITQDLFSAQIRNINSINLIDKRDSGFQDFYDTLPADSPEEEYFSLLPSDGTESENSLAFFTEIYRPDTDDSWECSFFLKNISTGQITRLKKKYDSYYKILTDAKFSLQELITNSTGIEISDSNLPAMKQKPVRQEISSLSLDSIVGTWYGEKEVSKIIIMRSGRGFVIFSNGASMNISVVLEQEGSEKKLHIVQEGNFNASFFPGLERKEVLNYADKAPPIEWNMVLSEDGTLKGKKTTLVSETGSAIVVSDIDVVWSKTKGTM